ncbi:MAG: HAD-IC family P-type ATPase [Planctomycetales bacterium]
MAVNGRAAGVISIADPIKSGAREQMERLRRVGLSVGMVTGDNQETAFRIGERVGISKEEIRAEVLPLDKGKIVREFQQNGRKVSMVGDGINDAPALAAADVGIAMSTGTDIALEAAEVTIPGERLETLVQTFQLADRTMRIIRGNLFLAFVYNVLCIPLAAGVWYRSFGLWLTPMFAGAAMALSSVSVVLNSLRLRRFAKGERSEKQAVELPSAAVPPLVSLTLPTSQLKREDDVPAPAKTPAERQ